MEVKTCLWLRARAELRFHRSVESSPLLDWIGFGEEGQQEGAGFQNEKSPWHC